jgi:hypothetical protein
MGGFMATGYLMKLIAGTQVLTGFLLLINRFVPLALALLAPVIVNIFLYHIFVFRMGIEIAIVVSLLEAFLAWSYRRAYAPMLAASVTPG